VFNGSAKQKGGLKPALTFAEKNESWLSLNVRASWGAAVLRPYVRRSRRASLSGRGVGRRYSHGSASAAAGAALLHGVVGRHGK